MPSRSVRQWCHDYRLITKESCESSDGAYTILSMQGQLLGIGQCEWGPRPLTVTEIKLGLLMTLHGLMALYFCNPITLLGGEVCCSPYRNKAQTDARTTLLRLGYPYNYEPLNFFRAATSLVCGFFAGFQILTYRRVLGANEEQALIRFVYIVVAVFALYFILMLLRWRVWSRDKGQLTGGAKSDSRASSAPNRDSGKANENPSNP